LADNNVLGEQVIYYTCGLLPVTGLARTETDILPQRLFMQRENV